MHTVLIDECIGCGLCVDPCPVDCIEMTALEPLLPAGKLLDKAARAVKAKQRHRARQGRLQEEAQRVLPVYASAEERSAIIKQEIIDSIQRVQTRKNKQDNEPSTDN